MYCYHCGYDLKEHKVEQKGSSFKGLDNVGMDTSVNYICPRCGHLIHDNASEKDVKELTRACHAELQRARNHNAKGMCSLVLGAILLAISIIFLLLSKKANNQFRITVTSPEFLVSIISGVVSVILLVYGTVFTVLGLEKRRKYTNLLNDINTKTFVQ